MMKMLLAVDGSKPSLDAVDCLVKHAKDKGCDLIFIGTRGLTSVAGALLGSTAHKVLSLSTVPVLLVK